jgi:hypothetical protein
MNELKPKSWRELPTLQISRGDAPSSISKEAARQMAFNVRSVETVAAELENRKGEIFGRRGKGR